ncbi:hypothetical protein FACS1894206_09090 [Deltaproteobacteria bacterium]|nr:hypothetical protein FACS1894206_09090 [Deltaproteobacteria bacterium]
MTEKSTLALLKSSDSEEIREGAYRAGKERLEAAIPLLVTHVQNPDIGVQEASDRALRKIGGAAVVTAMIPLLRSDDAPIRNIAMDLLREVGCTDIDALFRLLHDHDPDMRIFAADILGSSRSVLAVAPLRDALLRDREVNVRYQAAVSLGALAFPEAASSLNKALADEEWVQFSVIEALIKIRAESSISALVKALDSSSDLVASVIIDALGEMGNIKAVPLLIHRLNSAAGPLRNKIASAIIKILGDKSLGLLGAKERENLYEYMLVAIEDEDQDIQDAMVRGLSGMGGEAASKAIAALAVTIDPDRNHDRLVFVVRALAKIGFSGAIVEMVKTGSEFAQQVAIEVLSYTHSREGVELLKSVFWDKTLDVQRAIIMVLTKQCGQTEYDFFLDVLEKISDISVIKAALLFLGRRGEASIVSETVSSFLEHESDEVKEAALDACIALHDQITIGHLLGMAKEKEPLRRMMAVYALGSIDLKAFEQIVLKALDDPAMEVRRVAIEALGRDTSLSVAHQAAIIAKFADAESEIRLAVLSVLCACQSPRLAECLRVGLDDADLWVRVRCIETVGQSRAAIAVPKLVGLLNDENELIVIKSIEALGAIGGENAFRALFSLIDNDNPDIQRAAEDAVEKIRADEKV